MIKKILFVSLWAAGLPFVTTFIVILLCAAYLRMTLHGAIPSEHVHQTILAISTYTSQFTFPIALLLGVFGWLPGTRLRANSSSPSEWAKWCYRLCVAVALFTLVVSIFFPDTVWDVLSITSAVVALGVALIDKYSPKPRSTDC
jgi:L-asparagine transporter-like permease